MIMFHGGYANNTDFDPTYRRQELHMAKMCSPEAHLQRD